MDGLTKISSLTFRSSAEEQVENYRKLLLSIAKDARVIIIKLGDRLHNMRTLEHLPPERRSRIALETREIYAPLAHRFGMAGIKAELEDLAFKFLEPEEYRELAMQVAAKRASREQTILKLKTPLDHELRQAGIDWFEVTGRPKHLWSIFQKMKKRGKAFDEIYERLGNEATPEEWAARQELACAYRLFDHFGWHELIYNHITVRVPGEKGHFLINPFGLLYAEVCASNLVKIDIDQDKFIASQFQIQSIPTVYAFYKGQPVADISNYRSEGQLKRILDQLITQLGVKGEAAEQQAEIEPLIAMAENVLAEGDHERAANIFQQIRDMAPDNPVVIGGLARALLAGGQADEAKAVLDSAPADAANHAEVSRARAALELAEAAPEADTSDLEKRVASNPDDLDARFELAVAKMAAGDRDSAADALLDIISRDIDWNEGAARKRLLQLIEAQGLEDPWARTQRRRLSALLFT